MIGKLCSVLEIFKFFEFLTIPWFTWVTLLWPQNADFVIFMQFLVIFSKLFPTSLILFGKSWNMLVDIRFNWCWPALLIFDERTCEKVNITIINYLLIFDESTYEKVNITVINYFWMFSLRSTLLQFKYLLCQ